MLNVIALYLFCLYLISKALKNTRDYLITGILMVVIVCLAGGFLYYCAFMLALSAINFLGFFSLTLFPIYLGLKK